MFYTLHGHHLEIWIRVKLTDHSKSIIWCALSLRSHYCITITRHVSKHFNFLVSFNVNGKSLRESRCRWVCLKIVYPYTQWFCWSLSLLNGYFIGGIPHFQTYPGVPNFAPHNPHCQRRSFWKAWCRSKAGPELITSYSFLYEVMEAHCHRDPRNTTFDVLLGKSHVLTEKNPRFQAERRLRLQIHADGYQELWEGIFS